MMIRQIVRLASFILLGLSGSMSLGAGRAPLIPIEAFARLPEISSMKISPDGDYIAALAAVRGRMRLVVQRLENPRNDPPFLASVGVTNLNWFKWVNNERLILSIAFPAMRSGTPTTEFRLIAFNHDGGEAMILGHDAPISENPVQVQDNIIDMLADDREHVLNSLAKDAFSYPSVYRLNVYTNQRERIVKGRAHVWGWMTDHTSKVRLGFGSKRKRQILWVRAPGHNQWRVLNNRKSFADSVFRPLGFSADPNILYVASDHEGDRQAIYKYDLIKGEFKQRLFAHDRVDIQDIVQSKRRLVGFAYVDDNYQIHFVDDEARAEHAWLDGKLPTTRNYLVSETPNERRAIIRATNVRYPDKYYLLDRPSKSLHLIGQAYPALRAARLVDMQGIRYKARDGLTIHGYLSLPGTAGASGLPMVVMPHGGPTSRDTRAFNYLTQFMASRGYAVFQPNFRGSSGYGRNFQAAGNKQWGLAMQDDITDGVNWLIESGVADARRICIVGGSYGGYAALMGVVKTPDLYRCAVSFAGVTDLPQLLGQESHFSGSSLNAETIGREFHDRNQLVQTSPARQAGRIKAAVLVIHGDNDRTVSIQQARKMRKALKKAQVRYEYVELEDGDHHLSLARNRLIFLQKLEAFLLRYLGPGVATDPL